jgi:hypothetical protein
MKKVITPLLMLLPVTAVWGFDTYFYREDSNRPVHVAKDVTTLEFRPSATVLTRSDFTTAEVDNTTFHHMLFRDKSTSGITGATAPNARVEVRGDMLYVTSPSPVSSLQVSSASGMLVASVSSGACDLTCDMSALAAGIYIVRVESDNTVSISKIIKK